MDSTSVPTLQQRRADLRGERRKKLGKTLWQFLVLSSMATGLTWSATLPYWSLRHPSQVEVSGNQLLSPPQVRQLLALTYPLSLWHIPISQIRQQNLLGSPPILSAQLRRQVLPPRLLVTIQERQPVAIAYQNQQPGYLDAQGIFIPRSFYQNQLPSLAPKALKVFGYLPSYQKHWPEIWALLANFSPAIEEVHWQNPSNLVLKNQLGKVHFGPYSANFSKQLKQLEQLKSLGSYIPLSEIVYIDLSNPEVPRVQLQQKPEKKSLSSLVRTR